MLSGAEPGGGRFTDANLTSSVQSFILLQYSLCSFALDFSLRFPPLGLVKKDLSNGSPLNSSGSGSPFPPNYPALAIFLFPHLDFSLKPRAYHLLQDPKPLIFFTDRTFSAPPSHVRAVSPLNRRVRLSFRAETHTKLSTFTGAALSLLWDYGKSTFSFFDPFPPVRLRQRAVDMNSFLFPNRAQVCPPSPPLCVCRTPGVYDPK